MGLQELGSRLASIEKPTPSELKLVKYFESSFESLLFENIESLSKKAGVAPSTISRFITKLGYTNFREFIGSLRNEAIRPAEENKSQSLFPKVKRSKGSLSPKDILETHFAGVASALDQSRRLMRMENFERAVTLLCDTSRTLFTIGSVFPSGFWNDFSHHFQGVRPNCYTLKDNDDLLSHLANMASRSVLLAVSTSQCCNRTNYILQYFYEHGHETILLTDSYASPAYAYATVPIVVQMQSAGAFKTRCSVLAVHEAFVEAIAAAKGFQTVAKDTPLFGLLSKLEKM